MRVTLELYASLLSYLPPRADRHRVEVDVPDDTVVADLLTMFSVPPERAHLVLHNGVFVPPEERETLNLRPGDVIAVWPPVAGG